MTPEPIPPDRQREIERRAALTDEQRAIESAPYVDGLPDVTDRDRWVRRALLARYDQGFDVDLDHATAAAIAELLTPTRLDGEARPA